MAQIYATYIRVDNHIKKHFLDLTIDQAQTILVDLHYFHILVALTKQQNHLMSQLDNSFFNDLSIFKEKLYFVFQYNTSDLVPMYVIYKCDNKKIGIATKKKIIRLFSDAGVNIKEKKEKKAEITKFIFDY